MHAAITKDVGIVELSDIPIASPARGEILLKVNAVGLCGSDVHFFHGSDPYAAFPRVQGHEFSGTVIEAPDPEKPGDAVVGDLVAVDPILPCGTCYACRRGRYNCCMKLRVLGVQLDGALAEQIVVRRSAAHVANGVSPEHAAFVEPLAIGVHAVSRADITSSDNVVVFGAGAIGQAVTIVAADRGARVLVVDQVASRLKLALAMGAERVVDASKGATSAEITAWTNGDGAEVVVEATGSPSVLRQCAAAAAHGARVLVLGTPSEDALFPVLEISRKELDIRGSRNNVNCFPEALRIVRAIPERIEQMITQRFDLSEVSDAFNFATDHPEQCEKIMIMVS